MTLEQTPGFVRMAKHRPQWNAFIQQFPSIGFSIEWKTVSFAETGGPNKRRRLWIFAACPGQQMPGDIKATHGPPGSGLRLYVTVRRRRRSGARDSVTTTPRSKSTSAVLKHSPSRTIVTARSFQRTSYHHLLNSSSISAIPTSGIVKLDAWGCRGKNP